MSTLKTGFDLYYPLIAWNASLAVFSILGCVRMSPELFHVLANNGFEYSMCNASFAQVRQW